MTILLYLAAIIPGLLICGLIYYLDKDEREGLVPLAITFVLGMLSALPAIGLQLLASKMGLDFESNLALFLIYVFIVVALSEELVKLLMAYLYPFRQPFFNEPLDGIVYMMMVGMGFAIVENVIYAYNHGIETVLVRTFTAVPAHAIFAIFMGYFLGLAKFNPAKKRTLIGAGLGISVGIHGMYDFFILQNYIEWLAALALVTLLISGYLAYLLIKDHRENSPFRKLENANNEHLIVKDIPTNIEDETMNRTEG